MLPRHDLQRSVEARKPPYYSIAHAVPVPKISGDSKGATLALPHPLLLLRQGRAGTDLAGTRTSRHLQWPM